MAKQNLTDRFIQSRKPAPQGRRDDYLDAVVPGLALRVTDRGHKSFVLVARYPLNPRNPTRRALGDYGAFTLEKAREKARSWLELIERGTDPKTEEARLKADEARKQSNAFGMVAALYIERHIKGPAYVELERLAHELQVADASIPEGKALARVMADPKLKELAARSQKEGIVKKGEAVKIIEGEFVKRWEARPITEIMPDEAAAAIRAIVKRGAPYQAHNAFGYLRGLFNWAIGTGEFGLTASPVERLQPAKLIGKREARIRILTDDELRTVWQAASLMGYPYGPLVQLLILTGQREREVSDMHWGEVDLKEKLWTIPAERMKADRAHEVPLAPEAIRLLKALPRFMNGEYVFSTTHGEKPVNGFSKAKVRLDKLISEARAKARAGEGAEPEEQDALPPWVFHDLRRTMRTHLSALPVQDLVRELVIAHAKPGLHKVYDQFSYRDEKRECLELYEDWLVKRSILSMMRMIEATLSGSA